MPEPIRFQGCQEHLGNPQLKRKGNPVRTPKFTNTVTQQSRRAKEVNYQEEGCSQYLPSDLRALRQYFCSKNTLRGLQFWCMIMVATILGLRYDEYHEIDHSHFKPALFEIAGDDSRIDSLVLMVLGKSDNAWVTFRLHADHDHPDLCPVRPLLIYMYLIQIKGGYLFPASSELSTPPEDRVYKTTVDYKKVLTVIKSVSLQVLPPRPDFKVGSHIFRKTFYLLGVFGDANDTDLRTSARHKSEKNCEKYRKSAASVFNTYKNSPTPDNEVSKWKQCMIDSSGEANQQVLMIQGGCKLVDTSKIGEYFVQTILQYPQHTQMSSDIRTLLAKACSFQIKKTPLEQVNEAMGELPQQKQEAIRLAFERYYQSVRGRTEAEFQQEMKRLCGVGYAEEPTPTPTTTEVAIATAPANHQITPDNLQGHQPPNQNTRHMKTDLLERHELKSMQTAKEKIDAMVRLQEERSQGSLTGNAKSWASKFLRPVVNCLGKHFDGNTERFAETYPDFQHTTFFKKHCNGCGDECGV